MILMHTDDSWTVILSIDDWSVFNELLLSANEIIFWLQALMLSLDGLIPVLLHFLAPAHNSELSDIWVYTNSFKICRVSEKNKT